MIDYATFLQVVQNDHLRLMMLIAHRQTIATQSGTEADAIYLILSQLYTNGLITRGERAWEKRDGLDWQVFEATAEPTAVAYLSQMCMDRIKMSRAVIPPEPLPNNVLPNADFNWVSQGLVATFTDASTDGDGTIIGWAWDFGDGHTDSAKDPIHTYQSSGSYEVTFTVTDNRVGQATVTKTVIVVQN